MISAAPKTEFTYLFDKLTDRDDFRLKTTAGT